MELWYALVDLLPFDWAQPGSMYFMKNALLAVLVISPLFGVLSTMVVHSRMSFFSDALGHSAFTGMAIGAICGFNEPTWAAVLFAVVFALLFNLVRPRSALASDTVIGVFSSTAVALGIFLSTLGGRSFTKFNSLLIGDILSVEPEKIALLAGILLVVLVLWGLSFNQLMLSAVHPALADSRGVKVFWQETVFSIAIAVVVTVSMTWVGLLVINSLLVLPAAAARNVSRTMFQYHLVSLLGAVLDLSFWIIVTVALFVWSQQAWRGEIRLYGIFFLFGGGVLYFWLISTWMLKIGYFLADAAALVWRILTLPLAAAGKLQKKTKKFAKNSFHFAQEWFRINQITEELDAAARRRERRETGGSAHAVQASRSFDQGRGDGPADLHGHGPAGSPWADPDHPGGAGGAESAGGRPAAGKPAAGQRHRKQRRS